MIPTSKVSGMTNFFGTSLSLISEDVGALVFEIQSGSDCRGSGGESVDRLGRSYNTLLTTWEYHATLLFQFLHRD